MRFEDLTFKQMADQFHGPGDLQALCTINGVVVSVRREPTAGKFLYADAERPYEVLAGEIVLGYMTSSKIDALFAHIERGGDPDDFEPSRVEHKR